MINWTDELKEKLFDKIATGDSIQQIAGKFGFPSEATIYRKMANDEDFARFIARAREMQQEHEADYCIELADSATPEDAHVKKLQIWARQWRASKLAPKKYGELVRTELSGPEGKPLQTQTVLDERQEKALAELVETVQNKVRLKP